MLRDLDRENVIRLLNILSRGLNNTDPDERRPSMIIVGGAALQLLEATDRMATHDIDVLEASQDIYNLIPSFNEVINDKVSAFCDSIPYNYEDRLQRIIIPDNSIDVYTPSIEDIAVMKLYGYRENDIADLESEKFLEKINWNLLDHLVYDRDEAEGSILSYEKLDEMRSRYNDYREVHCDEDDLERVSQRVCKISLGKQNGIDSQARERSGSRRAASR